MVHSDGMEGGIPEPHPYVPSVVRGAPIAPPPEKPYSPAMALDKHLSQHYNSDGLGWINSKRKVSP